jgi:hypothetical protein
MKQLYVWRATLPELDPFPDTDVLLLSLGSFWYSYLLMMSHLIELFILSQRFLTCVENGPLNDAVLLQCEQNVLALTSIIRGTMIHVPDFANMPGLSGYCVFIGAVFLIALGHRKPYLVEQSTAHVSVLLTVTHVSKFLEKAAEMLIQFQQNPVKAIDHLKTICNKS